MYKIFIGHDSRFPHVSSVAAYSLNKHTSKALSIQKLDKHWLSLAKNYCPDKSRFASTEFTYSRFLVPYLCNYRGIALFMDNDMLCLSDITKLFELDMSRYFIRCVHHDPYIPKEETKMYGVKQTTYRRKNWSSLMLLNCKALKYIWTKEVVEKASGAYLHQFQGILNHAIGKIDPFWNHLDYYDPKTTKMLHYTTGGPWFEEYKDCPNAELWNQYYKEAKEAGYC